jgi:hypothetical protein
VPFPAPTSVPFPSPTSIPTSVPTALPTPAPTEICEYYLLQCGENPSADASFCNCPGNTPAPAPVETTYSSMNAPTVSSSTQSTSWVQWWSETIDSSYFEDGQSLIGVSIDYSFKDQGWGNAKGWVSLRLEDTSGTIKAYDSSFYATSDRSGYKSVDNSFSEGDDMVDQFATGDEFTLSYIVGGGGGHAIYVTAPTLTLTFGAAGSDDDDDDDADDDASAAKAVAMSKVKKATKSVKLLMAQDPNDVRVCNYERDYPRDSEYAYTCDYSADFERFEMMNATGTMQ